MVEKKVAMQHFLFSSWQKKASEKRKEQKNRDVLPVSFSDRSDLTASDLDHSSFVAVTYAHCKQVMIYVYMILLPKLISQIKSDRRVKTEWMRKYREVRDCWSLIPKVDSVLMVLIEPQDCAKYQFCHRLLESWFLNILSIHILT